MESLHSPRSPTFLTCTQPLAIVINKIDIAGLEAIPEELKPVFDKFTQDGIDLLPMSTLTETGVMDVKTQVRGSSRSCCGGKALDFLFFYFFFSCLCMNSSFC
jgi:hypothetical protein